MLRLLSNRNYRRQALTWLATLALLLRALVPDGYMPNQADDESFIFQLCSTHGVKSLQFDFTTGEYTELASPLAQGDGNGDPATQPCPYSISLLAIASPIVLEFFQPSYRTAFIQPFNIRAPPQLLSLPPLPARGPPALLRLTQ